MSLAALILSTAAAILWFVALARWLRGFVGGSTPRSTALDRLRAMQFEGNSR
jgi:hypothetical protein